jgi:hypothetical protein
LSGSVDGTARIWEYSDLEWKCTVIDGSKTLQKYILLENIFLERFIQSFVIKIIIFKKT